MTEEEARKIVYGLGTAMLHDDKELREMMYEGLSNEDLKKVLRWAMRQNLRNFQHIALISEVDPLEAWKAAALGAQLDEFEEEN